VASCGYPDATYVQQTAKEQAMAREYAKSYTEKSKNLFVNGEEGSYLGFLPQRKELGRIIEDVMDPFFDEYAH